MKTKISIVIIMVLSIFLTGCSLNLDIWDFTDNSSEKLTPKQIMEEILDCFEKKDAERLKSLFSEKANSNEDDLNNEISEAFDFFKGNVVSVGHVYGDRFTAETREEYGITKKNILGEANDIEMDNGKVYTIAYAGWEIFKADETALGVNAVTVYKPNTYDDSGKIELVNIGSLYDID